MSFCWTVTAVYISHILLTAAIANSLSRIILIISSLRKATCRITYALLSIRCWLIRLHRSISTALCTILLLYLLLLHPRRNLSSLLAQRAWLLLQSHLLLSNYGNTVWSLHRVRLLLLSILLSKLWVIFWVFEGYSKETNKSFVVG